MRCIARNILRPYFCWLPLPRHNRIGILSRSRPTTSTPRPRKPSVIVEAYHAVFLYHRACTACSRNNRVIRIRKEKHGIGDGILDRARQDVP